MNVQITVAERDISSWHAILGGYKRELLFLASHDIHIKEKRGKIAYKMNINKTKAGIQIIFAIAAKENVIIVNATAAGCPFQFSNDSQCMLQMSFSTTDKYWIFQSGHAHMVIICEFVCLTRKESEKISCFLISCCVACEAVDFLFGWLRN